MNEPLILRDILYGAVSVPDEYVPFLRIPEFLRLRGVRLSNIDSVEFKDLGGPSRWEHAVGVMHLAQIAATERQLPRGRAAELVLAALLHDIATPPFAHTAEYVLDDYDHEQETYRLLSGQRSRDVAPSASIYLSETPGFEEQCNVLSKRIHAKIDIEEVARMVVGEGSLGFLISGTIDLDNADNVTRASLHMGLEVDPHLPERIAKKLARLDEGPLQLVDSDDEDIRLWAQYRARMYKSFFGQSLLENGREAFLQHLFRTAVLRGVSRRRLVWNTDEGLLATLESHPEQETIHGMPLREMVRRYRLLDDPTHLFSLPIFHPEMLAVLGTPAAATWIEGRLTTPFFEPLVSVARNRFSASSKTDEIEQLGELRVFKLGRSLTHASLPVWLQKSIPSDLVGRALERAFSRELSRAISKWAKEEPWAFAATQAPQRVVENLEYMGDWAFRNSKNSPIHTYPSTFVQAIPASLIHALGVSGELVIDTFGGTGNTMIESVRAGGRGISADSNSIATMIANTRLTYLGADQRSYLRDVGQNLSNTGSPVAAPEIEGLERWHHKETLAELQDLLGFSRDQPDPSLRQFLLTAFSAILTDTTARRGLQHGFFADNTPLPKGLDGPPYVDARKLFASRVRRNLGILEKMYASLERNGLSAKDELERGRAVQLDCRTAAPGEYGLAPNSAAAVVTSPPYLCMTDYTLGHRLSYYWLGFDMGDDFQHEIAPRRSRSKRDAGDAVDRYLEGMREFGEGSHSLLRQGGYLALVIGAPTARAFEDQDILTDVDVTLEGVGFRSVWADWRDISWSRNHGYSRLKRERLVVYQRE